ncbi:uncharacterized protein TRAVEDRAFT_70721 [Trametes versicolor FP-101664 SS1]|uniref:uncharacterized protein n=1 Tax=Trametes versicolor (strain FP-101664) TaxID=717944 RepID=UPI0004622FBD|nr:uncharacterized protein TRAVEDRAFT_70721 [Trametes versicolor FP-101664 SS1]EIW60287.1 hypothetical protein TRAVEDRAFT_70721 [Trametes versicolor FP-101664 SS1]
MDAVSRPLRQPASSPFSRLPDDTLYAVFELLRSWICFPGESDDVPYDPLPDRIKKGHAAAIIARKSNLPLWTLPIVLSSVCSRWRAFAIGSPRLWSFIRITGTFPNRMMMNAFLERSQDIPLSILLTKPAAPIDRNASVPNPVYGLLALASELADVSTRILELGVVLPQDPARILLEALNDTPLPRLQKLWLDAGHEGSEKRFFNQLLNVNLMTVRTLHARQFAITWMPFEGLVRLELSSGPAPTLPALLYTLKHSPQLEVLQLRVPALQKSETVPHGQPPIELALLKELLLSVEKSDPGAFGILPHISFPSTTEIDIHFTGRPPSCLYENCESLRQIAASVADASIFVDLVRGVTIESDDPVLTVDYGVKFVDSHQQFHPRLHAGLLAVPLPALAHLSLSIPLFTEDGILQWQFGPLFSAIPTVTRLTLAVHVKYTQHVATALSTQEVVADGGKRMRCQSLRRLTFVWCGEEQPSVDDFWLVERCCAARAAAGVRIETLETTVAVPELVMGSLLRSIESVVVLDDY